MKWKEKKKVLFFQRNRNLHSCTINTVYFPNKIMHLLEEQYFYWSKSSLLIWNFVCSKSVEPSSMMAFKFRCIYYLIHTKINNFVALRWCFLVFTLKLMKIIFIWLDWNEKNNCNWLIIILHDCDCFVWIKIYHNFNFSVKNILTYF